MPVDGVSLQLARGGATCIHITQNHRNSETFVALMVHFGGGPRHTTKRKGGRGQRLG
jgi:hypothetical protein